MYAIHMADIIVGALLSRDVVLFRIKMWAQGSGYLAPSLVLQPVATGKPPNYDSVLLSLKWE